MMQADQTTLVLCWCSSLVKGMTDNHFNLLGLPLDATDEEIKAAYYQAARLYHPDTSKDQQARAKFLRIQDAYNILADRKKRVSYIEKIKQTGETPRSILKKVLSKRTIPLLAEPQLTYLLVELSCEGQSDQQKTLPTEICLVIDRSTSMKGERLNWIKTNLSKMINRLNPDDVISIIMFSDWADVLLEPTTVRDCKGIERKIAEIDPKGGTEMFKGLELGANTIMKSKIAERVKRIFLLTDGRTYGDEEQCCELAKKVNQKGISIFGLGFGSEWNDAFLDKLTSLSGGNASLIRSGDELFSVVADKIGTAQTLYGQNVNLAYKGDKDVRLNYVFRLVPDASPLEVDNPLQLGNLYVGRRLLLLFEFVIEKLKQDIKVLDILDGKISMEVPTHAISTERHLINLKRPVTMEFEEETPPSSILNAISKLTLYRIQEKARHQMEQNEHTSASRTLEYLAAHLDQQGEKILASTVMLEAQSISKTGRYSQEGDKRIKYGTRSLLLQSGLESIQL
jgi:Ca-activated chloride channel family protein